ncbi:MAG TPA: PqqD family peptide modification chaperone [bacterium]|nr:PqqD family peptide modification chaperone [bacterium]
MNQTETAVQYACNPDVVLREEDEDGGLLFNPDTCQIQLLNATGLYIWKRLDSSMDLSAITANLVEAFADAPADQAGADVREFIAAMREAGFVGVVEQG